MMLAGRGADGCVFNHAFLLKAVCQRCFIACEDAKKSWLMIILQAAIAEERLRSGMAWPGSGYTTFG